MALTAEQIEQLCKDWCAASRAPDGGMAIGAGTEGHRLLANGVVFHELDFECLEASLTGTTMVLLRPGLNTIVVQDHFVLWSWCAELLLSPRSRSGNFLKRRCMPHSLTLGDPLRAGEEWEAQNKKHEIHHHQAKYFVQNAHYALAYLAFPLLEAMLKRACCSFVTFDGTIVTSFSVPKKTGATREYFVGKRCSSLRDLLHLHYSSVATAPLRLSIGKLRFHLAELDCTQDPFDTVYSWRNDSLHGSASLQTVGGTLLSWSFLIALHELKLDFEQRRRSVIEGCRWELQSGHRSPWSIYPP